MNTKCTNDSPTSDKEKWGTETPGMNPEHEVDRGGHRPNGDPKKVGDSQTTKHWSGH